MVIMQLDTENVVYTQKISFITVIISYDTSLSLSVVLL